MAERPDILIIMPDQMRADCMGCAGNDLIETPNLDRLAESGVRFSRCSSSSPVCMPARYSFVSGTYPHSHGMWSNAGCQDPFDETIFHRLRDAGYFTAHIGKSHFYQQGDMDARDWEPYMRARGYDHVHETAGPWANTRMRSYMTDHWQERGGLWDAYREDYRRRREHDGPAVWPSPHPVDEYQDSYVGRVARDFVSEYDRDEPMCMFVGFPGPHEPWDAPGEYAEMYDPEEMTDPIPPSEAPEWLSPAAREHHALLHSAPTDPADARRMAANYYGKITLIDRWIGEILHAQQTRRSLDETIVIVWSDHGEMLGDHGRVHKSVFFRSAVQVPLIVRWPGMGAGVVRDELCSQIDLFPTLLDGLGVEPSQRAMGRSLMSALRDEPAPGDQEALGEIDRYSMIQTPRYKYVVDDRGDGVQLFDTEEDPDETVNLCGREEMAGVEAEMRDRLLRFWARTQARRPFPTDRGVRERGTMPRMLTETTNH
ncbi:MAG: sulfatase [Armatimonadota bacterium]|jgi:arylsulfatase A-like enzyme